jgi:hypothetical protein
VLHFCVTARHGMPNQWFYIASKLWLWGCRHSQKIF